MTEEQTVYDLENPPVRKGARDLAINPNGGLRVDSYVELMQMAALYHKSGMAPSSLDTIEKVAIGMATCLEIGVPIVTGLQHVAVINGRASIWGDLVMSIIQGSGLLEQFEEAETGTQFQDDWLFTCNIKRKGRAPAVGKFSWAEAKRAGLSDPQRKGGGGPDTFSPWRRFPRRMMMWAARRWVLRDQFADVLKGIVMAEDALDTIEMGRGRDGSYRAAVAPAGGNGDQVEAPKGKPTYDVKKMPAASGDTNDPIPESTVSVGPETVNLDDVPLTDKQRRQAEDHFTGHRMSPEGPPPGVTIGGNKKDAEAEQETQPEQEIILFNKDVLPLIPAVHRGRMDAYLQEQATLGQSEIQGVMRYAISKPANFIAGYFGYLKRAEAGKDKAADSGSNADPWINGEHLWARKNWINIKTKGFSTYVYKNQKTFFEAPEYIRNEAIDEWAGLYKDSPWPLTDAVTENGGGSAPSETSASSAPDGSSALLLGKFPAEYKEGMIVPIMGALLRAEMVFPTPYKEVVEETGLSKQIIQSSKDPEEKYMAAYEFVSRVAEIVKANGRNPLTLLPTDKTNGYTAATFEHDHSGRENDDFKM